MFVGHTGEVYPAGFLPLKCGQFPKDSVIEAYQNHPTFARSGIPTDSRGAAGFAIPVCVRGKSGPGIRRYWRSLETEPDCVYVPREDVEPVM